MVGLAEHDSSLGARWCAFGLALSVLGGCHAPTQVAVFVDADPALRARIDSVSLRIFNTEGETLEPFVAQADIELPLRLLLLPENDNANRRWTILATFDLVDGGRINQTVEGGYLEDQLSEVRIMFDAECQDVVCSDGFRCQRGRCVERCVTPAEPGTVGRSDSVACGAPCSADRCLLASLIECQPEGYGVESPCPFSCGGEPAGCGELAPANIDTEHLPATAELVVDGQFSFITSNGLIVGSDLTTFRSAGSGVDPETGIGFRRIGDIGVFYLRRLEITPEGFLSFSGDGTIGADRSWDFPPVVLYVSDGVEIHGEVNAGASSTSPGPGGGFGGDRDLPNGDGLGAGLSGISMNGEQTGGGGASATGQGMPGGRVGSTPGGLASVATAEGTPTDLTAGSGGGAGAHCSRVCRTATQDAAGCGGAGGGAIQISTPGQFIIRSGAKIYATGEGGWGGDGGGGGGGGSGGTILLEAREFVLEPGFFVSASGAGGGGGGASESETERGQSLQDTMNGIGGAGEGRGGNAGVDGDAEPGLGGPTFGGGGGGGHGRIRLHSRDGLVCEAARPATGIDVCVEQFAPSRNNATGFSTGQARTTLD